MASETSEIEELREAAAHGDPNALNELGLRLAEPVGERKPSRVFRSASTPALPVPPSISVICSGGGSNATRKPYARMS